MQGGLPLSRERLPSTANNFLCVRPRLGAARLAARFGTAHCASAVRSGNKDLGHKVPCLTPERRRLHTSKALQAISRGSGKLKGQIPVVARPSAVYMAGKMVSFIQERADQGGAIGLAPRFGRSRVRRRTRVLPVLLAFAFCGPLFVGPPGRRAYSPCLMLCMSLAALYEPGSLLVGYAYLPEPCCAYLLLVKRTDANTSSEPQSTQPPHQPIHLLPALLLASMYNCIRKELKECRRAPGKIQVLCMA